MSSSSLSHSLNVRFASCIKNSKFGAHSEVRQAFRICFENVVSCVAKIGLISPKRLTSYDGAIYGWAFLDGAKLNQGATCDLTTIQQHQWTWCHNKENHSQCIGVRLTFRMHKDKFLAMWNEVRTQIAMGVDWGIVMKSKFKPKCLVKGYAPNTFLNW